jgi:hypothetical protein
MNLPHVFAKGSVTAGDLGYPIAVRQGTCWLADDPLVSARPDLFSENCLYAVGRDRSWSGETPQCLTVPPEDDYLPGDISGAAMTARVRARSKAEQSRPRAGTG